MPKDGPRRRKNIFRHPKQHHTGRGYVNGPFNNHTRDVAVQTEHVSQRDADEGPPAQIPNGDEDGDGRLDGGGEGIPGEPSHGGGDGGGEEAQGAPEGNRQPVADDLDAPGRGNVMLGRAHEFFINYMRSRDEHNATQFPPARDGVEAFRYFSYAMDLLGNVMFQCRAQMEVMKEVFMPILRDEIDFDRQYIFSLRWINNQMTLLRQTRTWLLVLVAVIIRIMCLRRSTPLSKT